MQKAIPYSRRILAGLVIAMSVVTVGGAFQTTSGLIVEEVVADSVAAKAGLKVGDRMLSYDDKPVSSPAALQALQQNTVGKKEVVMRVRRGEETLTLPVPLGRLGMYIRPELPAAILRLYEEGKKALQAKNSSEAIARWLIAAKSAREAGDITVAAWLQERVGQVYEDQRQWTEAIAAHHVAWKILKETADLAAQSRTLTALGRCSESLNDFPGAARWYEQARQVDTTAGNEIWLAYNLNRVGIIAGTHGEMQAAHDYLNRALAILERLVPDSLGIAASLGNLGIIAHSRGDLQAAEDYYSRSLDIQERLAPNSVDVATNLGNLGNIAHRRGDLQAAEDYYSRSLDIQERLAPNSVDVATNLGNLGNVAGDRGDLNAAQDYYSRALAIKQRLAPNSLTVADSLNGLGNVAGSRGELQAAQDYHNRALAIRERLTPNSLDVAVSLNNLGLIALDRRDLKAAEGNFKRALDICERLAPNSGEAAAVLNNLGNIASDRGDVQAAQDYYSRALAINERLAPGSLNIE